MSSQITACRNLTSSGNRNPGGCNRAKTRTVASEGGKGLVGVKSAASNDPLSHSGILKLSHSRHTCRSWTSFLMPRIQTEFSSLLAGRGISSTPAKGKRNVLCEKLTRMGMLAACERRCGDDRVCTVERRRNIGLDACGRRRRYRVVRCVWLLSDVRTGWSPPGKTGAVLDRWRSQKSITR
jgi:hypothetical protein